MSKILRVVEPFFVMEVGDTFELSADGKRYISEYNEEYNKYDDDRVSDSSYHSSFSISVDYAKELIEDGVLEEVVDKAEKIKRDSNFVNVFDEIDNLLTKYNAQLETLDEDMVNSPQCLKVERKTVLSNMVKLLSYLKNLKK